jgi:hypothetical protein
MAKKISSKDLFEQEDIFKGIRDSAEKTLVSLNKINDEFKQTATTLKQSLGSAKFDSSDSIKKFTAATAEANKIQKQSIEIQKLQEQVKQQAIKSEKEQERLQQERIKTQKAEAQEKSRLAAESAKIVKAAENEANAYKKLEKNTRELKNQSKELGAEMLMLEQSGKKNSDEYQKLADKYKKVTQAAQQGDQQLKKLDKTVGDNFRNVGNYQNALGGLNKVLGAFGVSVGISQMKSFITESINLSRIQEKAVAQVAAGLESTGGIVGYTLDELKNKASALQKDTLFGDETILTDLTSIMLTFTNITGKAFDQAQQAALDLSTRMGGDLKGAAVQLGKALNDPVKGVTALRKVGVSFTEQQMEQIKVLTESGDVTKAQTIILNEMNKEFGGSAKAAAAADGGITQLSNAFGDAKEELGKMILEGLRPTIQSLKEFFSNLTTDDIRKFVSAIGTVATVVFKVTSAWIIYKSAVAGVNAANFLMNGGFKQITQSLSAMIPGTRAAKLEQLQLARAQQQVGTTATGAGSAVKGFGTAIKSIGWMALIAGVVELAVAFYDVASGAKAAREAQEYLDKYNNEATEKAGKKTGDRQKSLDKTIAQLQRERNEGKLTEAEFLKRKNANIAASKKQTLADIEAQRAAGKKTIEEINRIEKLKKSMEGGFLTRKGSEKEILEFTNRFKGSTEAADKEISRLRGSLEGNNKQIRIYKEEFEGFNEVQKDVNSEIEVNTINREDNTDKINANTKALKENLEIADLSREIQDEQTKQIKDDTDRALAEANIAAKRRIQDITETNATEAQKAQLIKEIETNLAIDLAKITEDYYNKKESERNERINKEVSDAEWLANYKKQLEDEEKNENIKIAQDELTFEEKQNAAKLASLEDEQKAEYEKRLAFQKDLNELNKLKQDGAFASQEEYDKAVALLDKKYFDKTEETAKKRQETIIAFADKTANYFKKKSDEKIKAIDAEMTAAEKQAETLKQLAADGNINAQQSLAEQQRIINEANLKKQKELKKQMRMEQGLALFKLLAAKSDEKNPLGSVIKDATGLMAFINSLPAFYDGTEDTGANGQGVDGKGGFHAVLHPNERVVPKSLNEQIGSMSNEQLAKLAQEYQNGRLVSKSNANASLDLVLLANKLDTLTDVIKNKPETNIALGEITQSAMNIVESKRTGNTTVYNRFKVRK